MKFNYLNTRLCGRIVALIVALAATGSWLATRNQGRVHAQDGKSKLYLDRATRLDTRYRGVLTGKASPLSLASTDFDVDGVEDLAVGLATAGGGAVAIHRGNLDAFAPQSEASFQAIARGDFPSPYLPEAQLVSIPDRPDFLASGDFIGLDGPAAVAGARGGTRLHVLARNASGQVGLLQSVDVGGAITAIGSHNLRSGKYSHLLVGIHGTAGSQVVVYRGSAQGLSQVAAFRLSGDATSFAFGNLDGDRLPDALILAGGKVSILHGVSQTIEPLSVPYTVSAAALGNFVFDRDPLSQIALLATDGSLHILTQDSIDQRAYATEEVRARRQAGVMRLRNPRSAKAAAIQRNVVWKEMESYPQMGVPDSSGRAPLMFRTRISSNAADDLTVLSSTQMLVLAHPDKNPLNGVIMDRPDLGADAAAAIPARVNIDGRPGVVYLAKDDTAPHVMMPLPDPTFTVNTTTDLVSANPNACLNNVAGQCSLREAVLEANATSGTDTIMIPAGTYTLTIARSANPVYDARTGTLDVTDSVNIVGAGQNTTIIQGGTSLATSVDKVFSFNQDITAFTNATVAVSNLTIQNGFNRGNVNITDGWGGAFDCDTGTNGTASVTLTNVTLNNNSLTSGEGGGFAMFNSNGGSGTVTVTSSIIQNNVVAPDSTGEAGNGGGIAVLDPANLTMTSTQVLNNKANTGSGVKGVGGGIETVGDAGTTTRVTLHSSTISGNTSTSDGGGIWCTTALTIDQSSVIVNNTAAGNGGGIWFNTSADDAGSLSKVAITGNSAVHGGGIRLDSDTGDSFTMAFSRLAGNSATTAGSNLSHEAGTATVINNWWGTNAPAGTIEAIVTTNVDPFIVLTHQGVPATIKINQSSTLTADMSKDNHGNAANLSGNLIELVGLPVTFNNPILGTIPQPQPETLNSSAQATATFNAGSTAGLGTANATVDQAVVPVNSNLIAAATESGTTVTITTVGVHGFSSGQQVTIAGVGVAGYNGKFTITGAPSITTFTYTAASGLASSSGGTASIGIVILQPPSITKSFSPTQVNLSVPSTVTFSITNGNIIPIDASFTDTLPTGLVVATPPTVVNNCGGTVTATAGAGSIGYTNNAFAVTTCTVTVNVQSATDNSYSNSVTIDSVAAGNGNTSTATLKVIAPPHITKLFGGSSIVFGATTSLTFTVFNPNTNLSLTATSFTDTMPAGLAVATPSSLNNTCGGSASAVAGSGIVSLSGVTLAAGTSCSVSLNVQGTAIVSASNSVTVSDTTAGAGNTSTASLVVTKAGTSTAVTSSVNPSVFGQSVMFTATITATAPGAGTPSGTVSFLDGGNPIGSGTLTSGVATFSTSALAVGSHTITTSYNGDTNFTGSTGSLTGNPQLVNKGNTAMTVTSNHNPSAAGQSVMFSATISAVSPAVGTPGGSVTFLDGGSPIGSGTLTGGLATFSTTTLSAGNHTITATYLGDTNFNGITGSLTGNPQVVVAPPAIAKAFGLSSIPVNGTTSLTFTITNPAANTVAETGVAFTDVLPSGLVVSTPNGLSNNCGGTATAVAGSASVSLTGGTIAASSTCQIGVSVTGITPGQQNNVTGNVTSTNGGTGNTASASTLVSNADTAPTVVSLTSTTANGTYGVGANIAIVITFNKAVNVTGTPQLALNSGGTASYTSGSGTAALTFSYTVAAGDNSAHLDATSTTALRLNGGSITDAAATAANLTLPAPGSAGSLGANSAIAIVTNSPTVVSYNVLWGSQSYNVIGTSRNRLPWQITGIQVVFSAPIASGNVNSLSGTGVTTTGFSGLGTNTLTWTISPLALGNFPTLLAGSGANALKDAEGNSLGGGAGFNQNLKILEADFNDDGVVNSADLVLIYAAVSAPYNIFADLNGDGLVSTADYLIARTRTGTTLP